MSSSAKPCVTSFAGLESAGIIRPHEHGSAHRVDRARSDRCIAIPEFFHVQDHRLAMDSCFRPMTSGCGFRFDPAMESGSPLLHFEAVSATVCG
jgi:hypothetical protein